MNTNRKRFLVASTILGLAVLSAFAFAPAPAPVDDGHKVLAKDVSHDDLFAVMKDFKHALGFECSDCHVKSATDPEKLEFSSNANPNKQVAIEMMKMVMEINRKHFGIKGPFAENYLGNKYQVTCYTCHHGGKEPATLAPVPPGEDH
jgi:hypothetical protein